MATIGMSPVHARKRLRHKSPIAPYQRRRPARRGPNLRAYQRVIDGSRLAAIIGAIALAGWLVPTVMLAVAQQVLGRSIPGSIVAVACGLLLVLAAAVRYVASARLRALRRQGLVMRRTLAVGAGDEITRLVDRLADGTDHPFVVVGACVEGDAPLVEDVPLVGRLEPVELGQDPLRDVTPIQAILAAVDQVGADTVCIAPRSRFNGDRWRALSWALNDRGVDLVSALGLAEVSSHRMRLQRAGGASLLWVMSPERGVVRRWAKAVLDRVLAALLLIMSLPIMLVVAVLVRLSSSGPIIYRQQRVGQHGSRFTMFKFRTMYADADRRRAALVAAAANGGSGPLFKMRDDPRVTRIGRFLRITSLDELPQLVNVLRGQMSLVGPRPPLPEEVESYDSVEWRRLRAVPGMTGLWQISGRSNLTWEESIRLDLRYVDNWSLGLDARLLWRTWRAVVRGTGAY